MAWDTRGTWPGRGVGIFESRTVLFNPCRIIAPSSNWRSTKTGWNMWKTCRDANADLRELDSMPVWLLIILIQIDRISSHFVTISGNTVSYVCPGLEKAAKPDAVKWCSSCSCINRSYRLVKAIYMTYRCVSCCGDSCIDYCCIDYCAVWLREWTIQSLESF